MSEFTEELKRFALEKGADLVGVAPVERFKYAPFGAKPQDLLPGARAVLSMAIWLTDTALDVWDCTHSPYHLAAKLASDMLDHLSSLVTRFLEKKGHRALLFPATGIGLRTPYDREEGFVQGARISEFSQRHAAVAAGLGEFGYHSCLLTPEYGPRIRLNSVITDALLAPDEMYHGSRLCTDCYKCVDDCPMNAISKTKTVRVRYPDRTYEYGVIDFYRCHWGQSMGLHSEAGSWHIGLQPPKHIDSKVLHLDSKRYPKGRNRQICGRCIIFCSSRTGRRGEKLKIRKVRDIYEKSVLYHPGGVLNTIRIEDIVAKEQPKADPYGFGVVNVTLHRYDREGISFRYRPEQKWKRDPLLNSAPARDWIYHLGSDEKKLSYLGALRELMRFTKKTPEALIEEAASGKQYSVDDRLKEFLEHLRREGLNEDECMECYLGARSFFVWNDFIENLRAVPQEFRKVVATNAYNWHKISK